MAYFERILMTTLLLLSIAEESKGQENNIGANRTTGSCCQTEDQSNVTITDTENIKIKCGKKEKEENINWYDYGNEDLGLEIFIFKSSDNEYTVPSSGGIFACTVENKNTHTRNTSEQLCNAHKILVIPATPDIHDNNKATYVEGDKITLDCHVDLTVPYALFWIATYNGANKCLSSAEMDVHTYNFSHDKLCCPTKGISQRTNGTKRHYLDIDNITISQSGKYMCTTFSYDNSKFSWKKVNVTTIQIIKKATNYTGAYENAENATTYEKDTHKNKDNVETQQKAYVIAFATIGGLAAIGLILCLAIVYIKYKGKQIQVSHRHSSAPTTEYECTPYAVCVGQESKPHTIYVKAKNPVSMNGEEYSEIELAHVAACNDGEYSEVGPGPPAKPMPEYSYIGMKAQVEPNSEYSEVGVESKCVYSKISK